MSTTSLSASLHEDIVRRICAEYAEMPGLRVTQQQAQRLWGLDADVCTATLDHLIASGFLCRTRGGLYVRQSDGPTALDVRMLRMELPRKAPNRVAV
jgi:hypothetical protein